MQYQERKRAEFEFHRRKQLKEEGEGVLNFQRKKLLKSPRVEVGPVGAGVRGNISVGSFFTSLVVVKDNAIIAGNMVIIR